MTPKVYAKVSLCSMEFYGYHGCLPEERRNGQAYQVDIDMFLDASRAAAEDKLEGTADYSRAWTIAREIAEGTPRNLMETVAYDIALRTLTELGPDKVTVRVRKPAPPVGGKTLFAQVEISLP